MNAPVTADDDGLSSAEMRARFMREERRSLRPQAEVGRFVILRELGHGAMGVVYEAFDPKLERRVALKLLLRDEDGGAGDPGSARLLQEAQALARLSHTNVVTLHDVGVHDGRLWLAMEYVAGKTLLRWSRQRRRSWREVLPALLGAARGVAAAHEAGLVHRDLKPENVMIGDDGRVRVMDFGLAAWASELQSTGDSDTDGKRTQRVHLTRPGAIPGTLAYRAPEQWEGAGADPATDQYSWCVMAWELLHGERPYTAADPEALRAAVTGGKLAPQTRGRRVPRWLRQILRRGLHTRAAQRWPSMTDLSRALERGVLWARLRSIALALAAIVIFGVGMWIRARLDVQARIAACDAAGADIAATWNAETRARVRLALLATGAGHARDTVERLLPRLDRQAKGWQAARSEACRHTLVERDWSPEIHARSMWCLGERRIEFESLIGELSQADENTVTMAVPAASGLSLVDPCADESYLERLPEPPSVDSVGVLALRVEIARTNMLDQKGRYAEGLKATYANMARARWLASPLLAVATQYQHGLLLSRNDRPAEAARVMTDVYFAAVKVGALEIVARASIKLVSLYGDRLGSDAYAELWARHAEVALAAIGDAGGLQAAWYLSTLGLYHRAQGDLAAARQSHERALQMHLALFGENDTHVAADHHNLGIVERRAGDLGAALRHFGAALAIKERVLGVEHPEVASSLSSLASVHGTLAEYDAAEQLLRRALAIYERTLGLENVDAAHVLHNLGNVLTMTGHHRDAAGLFRRALAIREALFGPMDPTVAAALTSLTRPLLRLGEFAEAKAVARRGLTIIEARRGSEHPDVAYYLHNLGDVLAAAGKRAEAEQVYARALAIRERTGPKRPEYASTLTNLANLRAERGATSEVRGMLARAIAIYEAAFGAHHVDLAHPLVGLARVELAAQTPAEAEPLAARAVALMEATTSPPEEIALAQFVHAQALWEMDARANRARAMALAESALLSFDAAGPIGTAGASEVRAWLRQRGSPSAANGRSKIRSPR